MSYDQALPDLEDLGECIHEDVECEHNITPEGNPECPCRCADCSMTGYELDEEYDAPTPLDEFDPKTGYSPKDDWLKD